MHIDRFGADIAGKRRKRLGMHHRKNSGLVDLTSARPLFDFNELSAAAGIQPEADADRLA